jgi:hypothetical protein
MVNQSWIKKVAKKNLEARVRDAALSMRSFDYAQDDAAYLFSLSC